MNINNDLINKAFSRLREADEAKAPSFDRVIRRSRSKSAGSFFEFFTWGGLIAGMALLTALLYFSWDFKKPTTETVDETAAWAVISDWTPSSDVLFADSGHLISSSSTTTDSWIEGGDTSKTQTESL